MSSHRTRTAASGRPARRSRTSRTTRASLAALAALGALTLSACSQPISEVTTQGTSTASASVAKTDVLNVAAAINATQASGEGYPADLSPATQTALSIRLTQGSAVGRYSFNAAGFVVCVANPSPTGAWALYDSNSGGVTESGESGGCPV